MRLYILLSLISILGIQSTCSQQKSKSSSSIPEDVKKIDTYDNGINHEGLSTAILAGGCFWCTEAAFHRIEGVVDVISGYAGGGTNKKPDYKWVCSGTTEFAEAIYIYYDDTKINYETLLDIFYVAHDPTTLNRQGNDIGPQYRSAIFYQNEEEKQIAEAKIKALNESEVYSGPIVTKLESYDLFWTAEGYHQDFYEHNPNQSYVAAVSRPKVEKVMKTFASKLKPQYKLK